MSNLHLEPVSRTNLALDHARPVQSETELHTSQSTTFVAKAPPKADPLSGIRRFVPPTDQRTRDYQSLESYLNATRQVVAVRDGQLLIISSPQLRNSAIKVYNMMKADWQKEKSGVANGILNSVIHGKVPTVMSLSKMFIEPETSFPMLQGKPTERGVLLGKYKHDFFEIKLNPLISYRIRGADPAPPSVLALHELAHVSIELARWERRFAPIPVWNNSGRWESRDEQDIVSGPETAMMQFYDLRNRKRRGTGEPYVTASPTSNTPAEVRAR